MIATMIATMIAAIIATDRNKDDCLCDTCTDPQVHVFPSRDGNLAIHVFGYVNQAGNIPQAAAEAIPPSDTQASQARRTAAVSLVTGSGRGGSVSGGGGGGVAESAAGGLPRPTSELLEYAASVQAGEWEGNAAHPPPGPMVSSIYKKNETVLAARERAGGGGGGMGGGRGG